MKSVLLCFWVFDFWGEEEEEKGEGGSCCTAININTNHGRFWTASIIAPARCRLAMIKTSIFTFPKFIFFFFLSSTQFPSLTSRVFFPSVPTAATTGHNSAIRDEEKNKIK